MPINIPVEHEPLKHGHISEAIIGAFYEVYNELGHGLLESVYREALACELASKGLRVEREKMVKVQFRNQTVGVFRTDLVIGDAVIVELKCARTIDRMLEAQLLNYLKATDYEVGLLLNFGYRPQFRRMFLSNLQKQTRGHPTSLEEFRAFRPLLNGTAGEARVRTEREKIRVHPRKSAVDQLFPSPASPARNRQ